MSMSVRQKQLTKKVMCSLLVAGVINVCISGGGTHGLLRVSRIL